MKEIIFTGIKTSKDTLTYVIIIDNKVTLNKYVSNNQSR